MRIYLTLLGICLLMCSNLEAQCLKNTNPGIHTVQKGETLYRIANQYNVSVEHLLLWNQLQIDDVLTLCEDLYVAAYAVPAGGAAESGTPATATARDRTDVIAARPTTSNGPVYKKQGGNRHIVQAGETVAGLADLYGYSEKRFREFNSISNSFDVTPGSVVLSSDCTCDRINYDDPTDYGYKETNTNKFDPASTSTATTTTGQPQGSTSNNNSTSSSNNTATKPAREPVRSNADKGAMSRIELDMVDEINLMRSNPSGYVRYVQAYVADQKANNGFPIDDNVVNELIQELNGSPVLSNLQPMACVYDAAQKHGQDLRRMGRTDHQGSDGLWPWDRVRNACPELTEGNENLVGGPDSVRESVIILLIDEGIPSRGHRKTLMQPNWKYVACYSIGKVGDMPNCWVQKFAY